MSKRITRRTALKAAAGAGLFTIVAPHVLGGRHKPPSERLHIAGVGVGGQGRVNLIDLQDENVVALCDVDPEYAAPMIREKPSARLHTDFRRMLDEQKDIDAVLIATPDHTHAVIALAALQCGKHVYCQKPLAHDIGEVRSLMKAAAEAKVVTQLGIQGHSTEPARLLVECVQSGMIGQVTEVIAWSLGSYYPWGKEEWSPLSPARPVETPAPPTNLQWDLWLGPAAERPYHPTYHPRRWRGWRDFGTGWLGDRGAHTLDPVCWALELGPPARIEAVPLGPIEETYPPAAIVTFHFPARGARPPVRLVWHDGVPPPRPPELEPGRRMGDSMGGAILRGDKGVMMCGTYGGSPRLLPESRMADFQKPPPTLPRVRVSHEQNWAQACKGQGAATAPFSYGGPLTEICLLGNIALRSDGPIEWDAANGRVTNSADANALVRPEYRKGWSR